MTAEPVSIRAIYRYPIKGLSPQALDLAPLSVGQTIPADRLYAIENGPSGFDPDTPAYFPKNRFLMLMRNERLSKFVLPTLTQRSSTMRILQWYMLG